MQAARHIATHKWHSCCKQIGFSMAYQVLTLQAFQQQIICPVSEGKLLQKASFKVASNTQMALGCVHKLGRECKVTHHVPALHALEQQAACSVVKSKLLLPASIPAPFGAQPPLLQTLLKQLVTVVVSCCLRPVALSILFPFAA